MGGFSKALLNSYTMLLARQRADLVVNAVCPGFMLTDIMKQCYSDYGKVLPTSAFDPAESAMGIVDLLFKEYGTGRFYQIWGLDIREAPLARRCRECQRGNDDW